MINNDINQMLNGICLTNSIEADNLLDDFMYANQEEENPIAKANVVKACSEALHFAVAKCFEPERVHEGFQQSFYERDENEVKNTKLLVTVLNGGKSTTSTCRYAKFYLVIDAYA